MSQQAALIAAANAKGGCEKTTTILLLAGEYAAQGYRVHIIDADPRRRAMKWAEAGTKPASITVSEANAAHMRNAIESASKEADVVLIDGVVRYDRSNPGLTPRSDFMLGQPEAAEVHP